MFRKTVKSHSPIHFACFGFSEVQPSPGFQTSASKRQVLRAFSCAELSRSVLPLMSLGDLLESGKVITGDVSYAPSDIADIERNVSASLSSYVSNVPAPAPASAPVSDSSSDS